MAEKEGGFEEASPGVTRCSSPGVTYPTQCLHPRHFEAGRPTKRSTRRKHEGPVEYRLQGNHRYLGEFSMERGIVWITGPRSAGGWLARLAYHREPRPKYGDLALACGADPAICWSCASGKEGVLAAACCRRKQ